MQANYKNRLFILLAEEGLLFLLVALYGVFFASSPLPVLILGLVIVGTTLAAFFAENRIFNKEKPLLASPIEKSEPVSPLLKLLTDGLSLVLLGNIGEKSYRVIKAGGFLPEKETGKSLSEEAFLGLSRFFTQEKREVFISTLRFSSINQLFSVEKRIDMTLEAEDGHFYNIWAIKSEDFPLSGSFIICFKVADEELQRKRSLENALLRAEAIDKAERSFLVGMSHEMKTPLNGILGLSALIKGKTDLAVIYRDAEQISISGKYLLALINDTLDLSSPEETKKEPKLKPENAVRLIDNLIYNAELTTKNCETSFFPSLSSKLDEELKIYTDAPRLEQALLLFLSCLLRHSASGRLDFSITAENSEKTILVEFCLVLTGIRDGEDFIENFSQHKASSPKSPSADFPLAFDLLSLLSGNAEAVKNENSLALSITFPFEKIDDEENGLSEDSVGLDSFNGKRVLLCEDNQINAEISCCLLNAVGIMVERAENGQQAVELFSERQEYYFDAVLMDIRMPIKNGIEATKEIRAINSPYAKNIGIIAMTANTFSRDIADYYSAGMNDLVPKPVDPRLLYDTLAKYI